MFMTNKHAYFTSQLQMIKMAAEQRENKKLVILWDFNLNEIMTYNNDYSNKSYYDELSSVWVTPKHWWTPF